MKANVQNPNIRDIIISLTEKETGTAAIFYATFKKALHVVMLIKLEDSILCFTGMLRKQGTGKKTASDKVVRLHHKKSNYIFTSDSIKETDPDSIIEFGYEGFLSTSEMDKARQVFNYGINSMVDKTSAITRNHLKRITNAMKQSIEHDKAQMGTTDRTNKNVDDFIKVVSQVIKPKEEVTADTVEEVVEEVVPEVIEEVVEDTLLDKLVAIEESSETQIAKDFVNRLLDVPFDESVLDKIKELDTGYFYNQGICIQYQEAISEADVIKVKIEEVQKAIDNLTKDLNRFKHNLKESESKISRLKSTMESLNSLNLYNEINEYVTKLEEENTAQKLAEKKIAEIMSSLSSETEVELLKKALGMTVSTELLSDAVGSSDVNVSLIDGNSITDKDGGWSWGEIKAHLVDVAQHRASASLKILEFIKAQNLSRKELESKLTQRYATIAVDEMAKVGLYKKRENNVSAMMTPEQRKERAAKAAASRKRNLAAKLAVLENSSAS